MTALDREYQYIRKWRPKAVQGDSTAMSNVAATYRILRNFRLAARWYKRAAERGDGDSMTEWGYCLQHGVGVRKNEKLAERGVGILQEAAGLDRKAARKMLSDAAGRVPVALVMAKAQVGAAPASAALKQSQGQVRKAIALAKAR